MGLKQDLIDAKTKAAEESGMETPDTSPNSAIEREAEYVKEAIVNFLTQCEFTITQLKAPIILEDLNTPSQPVDMKAETLMGDKAPLLKSLKKIGAPIPGIGGIVDQLEGSIKQAIKPILKGGADLPGLKLGKDAGGLRATGYAFIGDDPNSQGAFDVEDEDGQRQFTTAKVFREDIEGLL
jgi:hypothetical protein|tara:strand:+ start:259 stop:801 length:543 start_codon:yes stop_codon:yes gene_type:complete